MKFGNYLLDGRPVATRREVEDLTRKVIKMTSADTAYAFVRHTANVTTRFANGRVMSSSNGDDLEISITTEFGDRGTVQIKTNQLDESALRAAVQKCEEVARSGVGEAEKVSPQIHFQDEYPPVFLWHDQTVQAMTTARQTVIPELIDIVGSEGFKAAGFLGFTAMAHGLLTKDGIFAYVDETDSEVAVTARSRDGKASGWQGSTARDWTKVPYASVAAKAVDIAKRSVNARALEPGRRTAILTPAALAQMFRYMAAEFDAGSTDRGDTALSKSAQGGNRLRQQVFDRRVNMFSDPADPLGGYPNFFWLGYATPKMQWVENGTLKNLAYDPNHAMLKGKSYAAPAWSLHMTGGNATIEDMIAQCEEGIFVNRLSGVELIDKRTGMMTGTTRDGCFRIRNGKIDMPVKNFQFLDSPFFFLNRLVQMGVPERAAYGYTPKGRRDDDGKTNWPRLPMILPPVMVRDFNFSAMSDAV